MPMDVGIYRDLPFSEYAAIYALNASGLKEFAKSPAHFKQSKIFDSDTQSRRNLRANHTWLLEPHKFFDEYAFVEGDGRTKAIKEMKAEIELQGKTPITTPRHYFDKLRREFDAHPLVADSVMGSEFELTLVWNCPRTGIKKKGRLDIFNPAVVSDLKAMSPISDDFALMRQIKKLKYDWQAAHYLEGVAILFGGEFLPYRHIWIEDDFPAGVRVTRLSPKLIERAYQETLPVLELYARCKESDQWPASHVTDETILGDGL